MKRVVIGMVLVGLTLLVGSCELLGRAVNFAWDKVEDIKVMAIELVDDLPLERAEDLIDRAVALVRPLQQAASDFYVQLRGIDVNDVIDAVTGYAMVLFEDLNGDGEYSVDEPYFIDTNEERGFRLDRESSIVGSVDIADGELSYTAYNLTVAIENIDTVDGIGRKFTVTAPGAETVILHHSQQGWLPDNLMTRIGDRFVVELTNLSAGPFAYKFQIDDDVVWYPDPNQRQYYPNFFTFWEDENIDWNSALLLVDLSRSYEVTMNLVDLFGDATDGTDANFSIKYGTVQPFWRVEDDPWIVPLHDNATAAELPYETTVTAKSATLHLIAGAYYAVWIADDRGFDSGYLDNRVYLYAHPELDGGSFDAHMTKLSQLDSVYTEVNTLDPAVAFTEPDYANTYRGLALVNYGAETSEGDRIVTLSPWGGGLDFSLMGLLAADLPYTAGDDLPFVYQIWAADEDVGVGGELGLLDGHELDFSGLTPAEFPANAQHFGYSTWDDPPATLSGLGLEPELGIFLGVTGGKFFIDYFGIGHLVNIPAIRETNDTTDPHAGSYMTEIVLP